MAETLKKEISLKEGRLVEVSSYWIGRIGKSSVPNFRDIYDDQFRGVDVIMPTIKAGQFLRMVEYMGALQACVDAMKVNIGGLGYDIQRRNPEEETPESQVSEAELEYERLKSFFDYPNPDESFSDLRKKCLHDKELTGRSAMEVVRDRGGDIREIYHLPIEHFYMTARDKEYTEFEQRIIDERSGRFITQTRFKRFRRYVQLINNRKIFFKEFGDPREISMADGKPTSGNPDESANEVIFDCIYCPYDPYGQPRWIGEFIRLLGYRKSEEVNYYYFDNDGMPQYLVLVSGGSLTSDSAEELERRFHELKGSRNKGKAMVLESRGQDVGQVEGEEVTTSKIEVVPLTQAWLKDALYQVYQKNAEAAIRKAFRLSPMLTGGAEEYTRATAREALIKDENQVFAPERNSFDDMINRTIAADMQINHWKFKSLGNKTSDDVQIARALAGFKDAMNLTQINAVIAELTNTEVIEVPEGIDPDIPWAIMQRQLNPPTPFGFNPEEEADPEEDVKDKLRQFQESINKALKERRAGAAG